MDTTHSNPSPRLVEALADHAVVEAENSLVLRKLQWGNVGLFSSPFASVTPWKINMEPTNHPFRKENDHPNLHDYVPYQSSGVYLGDIFWSKGPQLMSKGICGCPWKRALRSFVATLAPINIHMLSLYMHTMNIWICDVRYVMDVFLYLDSRVPEKDKLWEQLPFLEPRLASQVSRPLAALKVL